MPEPTLKSISTQLESLAARLDRLEQTIGTPGITDALNRYVEAQEDANEIARFAANVESERAHNEASSNMERNSLANRPRRGLFS